MLKSSRYCNRCGHIIERPYYPILNINSIESFDVCVPCVHQLINKMEKFLDKNFDK